VHVTNAGGTDAIYVEDECEDNLPIKNCVDDNIIIIQEAENISITQEDRCVYIASPYRDQAKAADAFLFRIFGLRNF